MMTGEQTPGVVVTERANAGSALARLMSPILAVVAQLLLLDAAVETFWSGSPLRWWIAPAVVAFVALSVWLWRPGGVLARRGGWAMAAATSVSGLLLLFVATAWLPAGQSDGVRMLAQPTPVLLTVVTAVAVALAAFALVRAVSFLPATPRLVTRAVVVALAAYAVIALGLGVRDHTPYAALFHGGSFWMGLPRWLQGAFVGALGVVPLATLGQVVRFVGHLRRNEPVRVLVQQTTALVTALAMAASGVTPVASVPTRNASNVATATTLAMPSGREVQSPQLFRPRVPEQPSVEPQQLATEVDRVVRRMPPARYDLMARASQLEPGIEDAFRFVRDSIRYEPYPGILRGSAGTYIARAGNAADRSLLLATFLNVKGVPFRFASGRLARSHAARLLEHVFDDPVGDSGTAHTANVAPAEPPDFVQRLFARARHDFAVVRAALGHDLRPTTTPSREDVLAEIEAHVWVQAQVNGRWIDLDTAFPDSTPGKAYTTAEQVFDTPPDAMCQHVTLRVIAETVGDGELHRENVLEAPFNVLDLADAEVFLLHRPAGSGGMASRMAPVGSDQWTPFLWVNGEELPGQPITFGEATESIQDILGGGESSTTFVAEWLEIEIALPDGRREVTRRVLVDRASAEWRKSAGHPVGALRALARNANGVKAPQPAYNIWFSTGPHDLGTYAANVGRLMHAVRRRTPSDPPLSGDMALWLAAFQNFAWLVVTEHLIIPTLNDASHRFYADSPRVTILNVGPDAFDEKDRILLQADLRRDHLRGLSRSDDGLAVAERKLWFAMLEGALEHEMTAEQTVAAGGDASGVTSTSSLLGDRGVVVASAAAAAEVIKLAPNAETRERLAAAFAGGGTLVLSRGALTGGETGWWDIAAGTGDVRPVLGADLNSSFEFVNATNARVYIQVAETGESLTVSIETPTEVAEAALKKAIKNKAMQRAKLQGGTTESTFVSGVVAMTVFGVACLLVTGLVIVLAHLVFYLVGKLTP